MKQLLNINSYYFILGILLPSICLAQNKQYIGAPGNVVVARGQLMADSAFYYGRHDTTFMPERIGCVVQRPQDNYFYVYQTLYSVTRWYKYSPTSSYGVNISSDKVFSADTLSSNGLVTKNNLRSSVGKVGYSITNASTDTSRLINDSLFAATGIKYSYQSDSGGRKGYYQDKYIIGATYPQLRQMRIPDTTYIFRVNVRGIIGDYKYDPNDNATPDDTVMTIVSTAGYRYKRYLYDGVFDPKWWDGLAGTTGHDATNAIQSAMNAAANYLYNDGSVIRLFGNYTFDPINFIYPSAINPTVRRLTFEINGNVNLLNTWRITRGISIVGVGGAIATASFAWGTAASIQYTVANSGAPKAAIEVTYGENMLRDLTIGSYGGIGVKLNGIFFIPAAIAYFDNVSISVGAYSGKQTALDVSDWFWSKFDNCSFSVDGDNVNLGSSIKLQGKTYYPDINLCYLSEFNNCTVQGKPIRITASDTADASLNVGIVNITFRNLSIENVAPDTAAIMIDSRRIPVDNIIFERPVMVDTYNMYSFIYNTGNNTTGVKVRDGDLLSGQLTRIFGGDPIINKELTSTAKPTNNFVFNANSRQLYDNMQLNGYEDNINMNRGWKPPFELQLFSGGQVSKNAQQLKDIVVASAATVASPFQGYNRDTVAIKITPDGTNSNPAIKFKEYEKVWRTGDLIYFGAWVKSDFMDSILSTSIQASVDGGSVWQGSTSGTLTTSINYISTPLNGWRLLIGTGKIDASGSDYSLHKMYLTVVSNDTNRTHFYYVSNPFAYKIDSSDAVNVNYNEFVSWIKMNQGGLYNVPEKSYGFRNDLPIYVGDSSRFTNNGVLQRLNASGLWVDIGTGSSISLAAIGSSPNANGATATGSVLNLEPANGSFGGVLSATTQTIAGAKTFTSPITVSGNTANGPTGLFGNMNVQSFGNGNGFVANNLKYNNGSGGYQYIQNGEGSQFHFVSGEIRFEYAPSGTGGTAATASEAMRVTNAGEVWTSGNVSIASLTSPSWPLDVNGVIRSKGGTASFLLNDRGSNSQSILLYSPTLSNFRIYDFANNTDRVEVNNSGNVGIATSPTVRLDVNGSGRFRDSVRVDVVPGGSNNDSPVVWNSSSKYFNKIAPIPAFLTNSATLDFPDTSPGTSSDLTITVTGAVLGQPVILGVPNGSTQNNSAYTAWVSSTNTVTVRFLNTQLAGNINPASGVFRSTILVQ